MPDIPCVRAKKMVFGTNTGGVDCIFDEVEVATDKGAHTRGEAEEGFELLDLPLVFTDFISRTCREIKIDEEKWEKVTVVRVRRKFYSLSVAIGINPHVILADVIRF